MRTYTAAISLAFLLSLLWAPPAHAQFEKVAPCIIGVPSAFAPLPSGGRHGDRGRRQFDGVSAI